MFVVVRGTNTSMDPEALCNMQVHTLTWKQMSVFQRKNYVVFFKNTRLPYFVSLHHSLLRLLFNSNVYTLQKYDLTQADKHHCVYSAHRHLKSTSIFCPAINRTQKKITEINVIDLFLPPTREADHSVSDRSSIVQWHLVSWWFNASLHPISLDEDFIWPNRSNRSNFTLALE